jgi:hypothetical protein
MSASGWLLCGYLVMLLFVVLAFYGEMIIGRVGSDFRSLESLDRTLCVSCKTQNFTRVVYDSESLWVRWSDQNDFVPVTRIRLETLYQHTIGSWYRTVPLLLY